MHSQGNLAVNLNQNLTFICVNEKNFGPYTLHQLASFYTKKQITLETLCWQQGFTVPKKLSELFSPSMLMAATAQHSGSQPPISRFTGSFTLIPKQYAGFWIRFGAALIDAVICIVFNNILGKLSEGALGGMSQTKVGGIVMAAGLFFNWLYFSAMESSQKQGTLGKMALGLKVEDENRRRISFAHASHRTFAKLLSDITLGIGYLMTAFSDTKQALHDRIAKTYVVKKN